ncbi:hypothetical protein WDW86_09300 [Bdellovibrionota bacterium FG-2]
MKFKVFGSKSVCRMQRLVPLLILLSTLGPEQVYAGPSGALVVAAAPSQKA